MKIISKKMSKGFTLLEMLVVVLIVGILAGIALPQYNRAVEKTRVAEALLNLSSLQKAIDAYVLTHDYPTVSFLNNDPDDVLDIDLTQNMECEEEYCEKNKFFYTAFCSSWYEGGSCRINVKRNSYDTPGFNGSNYMIYYIKRKGDGNWNKYCDYTDDYLYIAQYLESMGIERGEAC